VIIKEVSNGGCKTFDVTVAANYQREKAGETTPEPLLTVFSGPSLKFSPLTHNEGEITVDRREKEFQIIRLQYFTESCNLIRYTIADQLKILIGAMSYRSAAFDATGRPTSPM
jgi:hypothetical protein